MALSFVGTEKVGIELVGTIPRNAASECAGNGLNLDVRNGQVPVSLVAIALEGLHAGGVPQVKLEYTEVLWRVGILVRDKPSWLLFTCDVDRLLARAMVAWVMSYPTRTAAVHVKDASRQVELVVTAGGKMLSCLAETHTGTPSRPHDKRRVLVRHGPRFYEVPWGHDAATTRIAGAAKVSIQDLAEETFGHGVAWDEEAVLWRGRPHGCGRPVNLPVL